MKKTNLFLVAFITFSMHAMDDELDEVNTQLSGCEISCDAQFRRDKPWLVTDSDQAIELDIALKERKTCYLDCFARYRAQVIMLQTKMLQRKK